LSSNPTLSGALTEAWSGRVFPALAIGGTVLLLFHQHEGGMLVRITWSEWRGFSRNI
jgi:hypothetical protein